MQNLRISMHTKFFTAIAFLLGTSCAHALTTSFITFADGPIGAQVDDFFIDQGVRFSSSGASDNTMNPTFTNEPKFKLDGVGVTDSRRTAKGRESFNIRVDFLNAIETVSAEVTSSNDRSLTMKAYNEFNTQIGRISSRVDNLGIFETLTFEDPDISYVIFETSLPYETSPVIDSLTFGFIPPPDPDPEPDPIDPPSTVPIPGALPLMLGGLALLGGVARSRRRTS